MSSKLIPIKSNTRSTKLERAERLRDVSVALAKGWSASDLVPQLMVKHNISRASAYRLIDDARIQRQTEEQLHWIEDDEDLSISDNQALMHELRVCTFKASEAFQETLDPALATSVTKFISSYQKLFSMGGRFIEPLSHKN